MERLRTDTKASLDRHYDSTIELLHIEPLSKTVYQSSSPDPENRPQGPCDNQTPSVMGWPQTAKSLRKSRWKRVTLLMDVAIALVPLLFISRTPGRALCRDRVFVDKQLVVLSLSAIYLSGSLTSARGHKVKSATTLVRQSLLILIISL